MSVKTTIVMRSMNDTPELVRQTLTSLKEQENVDFSLVHIDSGSTDGTIEVIKELGGDVFYIRPNEYIPGFVLNAGMELCDDEIVTFLNADATPVGKNWLSELLKPFEDENCVTSFSRQIPRADAETLFINDYERAFGDGEEHKKWKHFFSMAASAIRRSWWIDNKLDEAIRYSEDIEWSYRARLANKNVVYVPESIACHSHNYTLKESYKRHKGEGEADKWIYSISGLNASFARQVVLPVFAEIKRDTKTLLGKKDLKPLLHSPLRRISQKLGYYKGLKTGAESSVSASRNKAPEISKPTAGKYTIESNPEFESRLDSDFEIIVQELLTLNPKPVAIILGGGYGRREGGIIEIDNKPVPYNDYDLYAAFDLPLMNVPKKLAEKVHEISEELTAKLDIDVDVAPLTLKKLQKAPDRIEWFEAKRGNLVLHGTPRFMDFIPEYVGADLPYDEGERLLMNRVVGMILAHDKLQEFKKGNQKLDHESLDFVTRNIYKALLAAGDVILLRFGKYHYSYRERRKRISEINLPETVRGIEDGYQKAHQYRLYPVFEKTTYEDLMEFWGNTKVILKKVHLWFLESTIRVSDWNEYAEYLFEHSRLELKAPLYSLKNYRFKKGGYPEGLEWRAFLTNPQYRVRVSAAIILYELKHSDVINLEYMNDLHKLLLLKKGDNNSVSSITSRMLEIWEKVN